MGGYIDSEVVRVDSLPWLFCKHIRQTTS